MEYNIDKRQFTTTPDESLALGNAPVPLIIDISDTELTDSAIYNARKLKDHLSELDAYYYPKDARLYECFTNQVSLLEFMVSTIAFAREYHDLEKVSFHDFHDEFDQQSEVE